MKKEALRKYKDPFYSFFDDAFSGVGNELSKVIDGFMEYPYYRTVKNHGQCNLQNTDTEYLIDVSAPGFTKEELKVEIEDNLLTVKGEHLNKIEEEKKNYSRREFSKNSFTRSFKIPENITGDVNAKFENGVLSVSFPKKELPPKTDSKQIEIK